MVQGGGFTPFTRTHAHPHTHTHTHTHTLRAARKCETDLLRVTAASSEERHIFLCDSRTKNEELSSFSARFHSLCKHHVAETRRKKEPEAEGHLGGGTSFPEDLLGRSGHEGECGTERDSGPGTGLGSGVAERRHRVVPPRVPEHPRDPDRVRAGGLGRGARQRGHPGLAGHQSPEGVVGHLVLQPGRVRPPPPPLPPPQDPLPSPWKPLGPRRDRVPPGHRLFLWQPPLLGRHAGLHRREALPGGGPPLHLQEHAQEAVGGLGQPGSVGGLRGLHGPGAPGPAELLAAAAEPDQLPRRAAPVPRLAPLPALLQPAVHRRRPAAPPGGHRRLLHPHHRRAEPLPPRLEPLHPGQLAGAGPLPGLLPARRPHSPASPGAAVLRPRRPPVRALQRGGVSVLRARRSGPVPLRPHVHVCRIQTALHDFQGKKLQHLHLTPGSRARTDEEEDALWLLAANEEEKTLRVQCNIKLRKRVAVTWKNNNKNLAQKNLQKTG